jgi:small-conductance mechanosensitive channel
VLVLGCGDATINLQLRFFIEDPEMGVRNVMSEIYELLLFRFKEAKIKIPSHRQKSGYCQRARSR